MTIPRRGELNRAEFAVYRASSAFLDGRLEERTTVDWALRLKHEPIDTIKRRALLDLVEHPGQQLKEPWRSAWRLIEESWNSEPTDNNNWGGFRLHDVQDRLHKGDKSGSLIAEIVALVAPRLAVESFSPMEFSYRKPPKRPRSFRDLFSAKLTSGEPSELPNGAVIDPSEAKPRRFDRPRVSSCRRPGLRNSSY